MSKSPHPLSPEVRRGSDGTGGACAGGPHNGGHGCSGEGEYGRVPGRRQEGGHRCYADAGGGKGKAREGGRWGGAVGEMGEWWRGMC